MQHANQKLPSTEGRSMSRKRKNDASKIVDEWTKKQCETPRAQQVGYSEHKQQPLTKMSHTHRDFFVSLPPPSFGRTQAPTYKKCYNYIERGHLISQCLNPRRPPTPTPTEDFAPNPTPRFQDLLPIVDKMVFLQNWCPDRFQQ
jgi:hypothetical protein